MNNKMRTVQIVSSALVSISLSYFFHLNLVQFLTVSTIMISAIIWLGNDKIDCLPPGPTGFPLVGSIPWIIRDRNGFLTKMYQKYGPMFTMKLGYLPHVVINGFEMIKEFSNHPDCQFRPNRGFLRQINHGYGLLSSEGKIWKHQRRFTLHALRDYGMGKMQMKEKISQELVTLTKKIQEVQGKPMFFNELLKKSTSNILFNLAFNKTYDYDDPIFTEQLQRLDDHVVLTGQMVALSLVPLLSPFIKSKVKRTLENMDAFFRNADVLIDEHRRNFDPDDPRDLLDLYLIEMGKEVNEDNKEYLETFSERQLRLVISNLFLAGSETSSTTMLWALIYMVRHPEVQKKVQAELDEVVGTDRSPVDEDRQNLPYTVAALQEVERMAAVVPGGLLRSNNVPVEFNGYKFPSRTTFMLNFYAVLHDPQLWEDPGEFIPTRFLDADGKVFRPPYMLPFGSGKRNCVGEVLARSEIFLYFATLLQKFKFEAVSEEEFPMLKSTVGLINVPAPFRLCAKSRM